MLLGYSQFEDFDDANDTAVAALRIKYPDIFAAQEVQWAKNKEDEKKMAAARHEAAELRARGRWAKNNAVNSGMTEEKAYDILGLKSGAIPADIKKAFKERAQWYHPDHNPNDPSAAAKFMKARQAFDFLIEPRRR